MVTFDELDEESHSSIFFDLEDALGVKIDDETAERVQSVREIYRLVEDQTYKSVGKQADNQFCRTAQAFYFFRRIVARIDPKLAVRLKPSTNLQEALDDDSRPSFWQKLVNYKIDLPPMSFPEGLSPNFLLCLSISFLLSAGLSALTWYLLWPGAALVVGLVSVPFVMIVEMLMTPRLLWTKTRDIWKPLDTVRGMSHYLAYRDCRPDWIPLLTRRQIRDVVRLIVAVAYRMPLDEVDDLEFYPIASKQRYIRRQREKLSKRFFRD